MLHFSMLDGMPFKRALHNSEWSYFGGKQKEVTESFY
jgi:hypothetical protein